jgi:alternate signal-mediated exported protein
MLVRVGSGTLNNYGVPIRIREGCVHSVVATIATTVKGPHFMNKIAKAAIATAIGCALLLGGAGTLATWNASTPVAEGGTIVAGKLTVGPATGGAWSVQHLTAGVYGSAVALSASQFATFLAVPGDKLTYTATVPLAATGNNLVATTSLAGGAITASSASLADQALATALTASATTALTIPTTTGVTGTAPTYTFTPGTTGISANATVSATITYPLTNVAGAENASMQGSVSLADMAVSITQTY